MKSSDFTSLIILGTYVKGSLINMSIITQIDVCVFKF